MITMLAELLILIMAGIGIPVGLIFILANIGR